MLKKLSTLLFCALLTSCEEGTPRSFQEHPRVPGSEELIGALPAFDPSVLSDEEKDIFGDLSSSDQTRFSLLNKKQRAYLLTLLKSYTPKEAVWKAAEQDVRELSIKEQKLYFSLNQNSKLLFMVLDEGPTAEALRIAKNKDPNVAIKEAINYEIAKYSKALKRFVLDLDPQEQALFLTFSEETQARVYEIAKVSPISFALSQGKEMDIERLPEDRKEFIEELDDTDQILYLILSPKLRAMAIFLTKKLDLNLALEYASLIQTSGKKNAKETEH